MKKNIVLLISFCMLLSSCSFLTSSLFDTKEYGSEYSGARSKPYTIRGQTYHPLLTADGFQENGIASWYGPGFHGKKTANGERYDQYALTAAHKILPFNTQVKVTNMRNGKSVIVRINDRGPFIDGRVIDLSQTAARYIDMVGSGTAPVKIETMNSVLLANSATPKKTYPPKANDKFGNFYLQLATFSNNNEAIDLYTALRHAGWNSRIISEGVHFVQVGPFPSLARANDMASILRTIYPKLLILGEN